MRRDTSINLLEIYFIILLECDRMTHIMYRKVEDDKKLAYKHKTAP